MSASKRIAPIICPGLLNFPGTTPKSKRLVEKLLEQDRNAHHSLYSFGLHNHLSHHLLAAFDLGAPAKLLQSIYDEDRKTLNPLYQGEDQQAVITKENWKQFLGSAGKPSQHYASYLEFFTNEVAEHGVQKTFETYLLNVEDGSNMLLRFVAGVFHPLIQTGYGAEFGSDAMIAQGLAQTAIHNPSPPELYDFTPSPSGTTTTLKSPSHSLLQIIREMYNSPILKPVMPYDPDALLSLRTRDALTHGRPEEIKRLSSLWSPSITPQDKITELFWTSTLLFAGSGKPNRKPRLDFFLMHILNSTLFLPSLFKYIPKSEGKEKLLKAFLPTVLLTLLVRGRPRIDVKLVMGYTDVPRPPPPPPPSFSTPIGSFDPSIIGNPTESASVNPWPAIIASVLHAPDAHTLKAIRALYYAAQKYGSTPPRDVPGAFFNFSSAHAGAEGGEETHEGITDVDGTVFVRAAGVVMDIMGWVGHGGKVGEWDRSALGWDDAWKDGV